MKYTKNEERVTLTPHNVPKYKELLAKEKLKNWNLVKFGIAMSICLVFTLVGEVVNLHIKNTEISLLRAQNRKEIEKADQFARNAQMEYDKLYQAYMAPESSSIDKQIDKVFGDRASQAKAIFTCESGLVSKCNDGLNKDGSVDCGIAQVNSVHSIPRKYLLNPQINLLVAKQIYDRHGWSPWSCAKKLGIK